MSSDTSPARRAIAADKLDYVCARHVKKKADSAESNDRLIKHFQTSLESLNLCEKEASQTAHNGNATDTYVLEYNVVSVFSVYGVHFCHSVNPESASA